MDTKSKAIRQIMGDVVLFSRTLSGVRLRSYQEAVARAVISSVLGGMGLSFVVMFPRQSGKNELQAHIEAYLLVLLGEKSAEMVKVSPTYQPQSLNAMRRIERVLQANLLTKGQWKRRAGNLFAYKKASLSFLSGAPGANIVGATASTLLEVDEAQDVGIEKYDKEIAPMAASTNATRVFWGTAWTSQTLLARELHNASALQEKDGIRRVFRISAEDVSHEVPAYRDFVAAQVARLGRMHPLVRTQFFSEELDAEGGLFTPERISMMQGKHPLEIAPVDGGIYAMLVDLAGEDESARENVAADLSNPGRDASAITIVAVDTGLMGDALIGRPTYRVVKRYLWVGERHAVQYARIRALAEHWGVRRLVVDASGVGAGLASFLRDALGERMVPVVFNAAVKSRIGWGFLAAIDSGRFKEFALEDEPGESESRQMDASLQALFFRQLEQTQYSVQPGPAKQMRWSVPQAARDHSNGKLLHDDLVLSAALVSLLDEENWSVPGKTLLVPAYDPLIEMDKGR